MNKHYSIYPSLLDAYTYMQSIEDEAAREEKRKELIARINREPRPRSEAADRGTALNEIVDAMVEIRSPRGLDAVRLLNEDDKPVVVATMKPYTFTYDEALVDTIYQEVKMCLCQVYVECAIPVMQGSVMLYGYADYIGDGMAIDLKTTAAYTAGKYRDHWQHIVYPYCLKNSGYMEDCDLFSYLVAEVTKGRDGIIRAEMYHEDYTVFAKQDAKRLQDFLSFEFIPFLEDNSYLITNSKIFQ